MQGRDELGVLPAEILRDLKRCSTTGVRNALRATLSDADALIIAVPKVRQMNQVAGVEMLRASARAAGVRQWVVDPTSDLGEVGAQIYRATAAAHIRALVTGPRRTRWLEGEELGRGIVLELATQARTARRKYRVLVVDDEKIIAQSACRLLRALGHTCVTAFDGAAALSLASEFNPDVAILNVRLPDLSGDEVARRLREQRSSPLFLAAITGSVDATERSNAFDRHVVMPATASVLQELLDDADFLLAAV